MSLAEKRVIIALKKGVLIGTPDEELGRRLSRHSGISSRASIIQVVSSLSELRRKRNQGIPRVFVLDEPLFAGESLAGSLRELANVAPIIFLASAKREKEMSQFVAEGNVDFVVRSGDFLSLASSLIERRLRWAERADAGPIPGWFASPADAAELFRHEINNPLTGILGNAELVLSHSDRLGPGDTVRLQTVVELAVRLRETIRRLSNTWEDQPPTLKSA